MKCIKCGKDTVGAAVFCDECLEDMQRHPVKPGTPVLLPKRDNLQPVKHSRKRTLKPEQQVQNLKTAVRVLLALVVLLMAALAASILLLLHIAQITDTELTPQVIFSAEQRIVSRETIFDK